MNREKTPLVLVQDILGMLEPSVSKGLSIPSLLCSLNLPSALLDDPASYIDMVDCWRLALANLNFTRDETHLFSSRPLKRGSHDFVLSNVIHHSNDVLGAMRQFADAYNILHAGDYNRVNIKGDSVSFIVDDTDFPYYQTPNYFTLEFTLINIHCALCMLVGKPFNAKEFCTKRKTLLHSNHHLDFFNAPVRLNHRYYVLKYDKSIATLPLRSMEKLDLHKELFDYLLHILRTCRRNVKGDMFMRRVYTAIRLGYNHQGQIGHHLGVSVSTMRRNLNREGTSFRAMLASVKDEIAVNELLAEVHPDDIAEKLGYSDLRSFRRAFKRWHGQSPKQYLEGISRDRRSLYP